MCPDDNQSSCARAKKPSVLSKGIFTQVECLEYHTGVFARVEASRMFYHTVAECKVKADPNKTLITHSLTAIFSSSLQLYKLQLCFRLSGCTFSSFSLSLHKVDPDYCDLIIVPRLPCPDYRALIIVPRLLLNIKLCCVLVSRTVN